MTVLLIAITDHGQIIFIMLRNAIKVIHSKCVGALMQRVLAYINHELLFIALSWCNQNGISVHVMVLHEYTY